MKHLLISQTLSFSKHLLLLLLQGSHCSGLYGENQLVSEIAGAH